MKNEMRAIKSFVIREGRMTARQQHALESYWEQFGVDYQESLIDLEAIFGRVAPVVLEIGFGMGKSLLEMARSQPDVNFLGIEVHRPGVGNLFADLKEHQVNNVRVINHDAVEVLNFMIANESLSGFQLFFPDPWPKKRHHKRRIVKPEFIVLVVAKLKRGGYVHCATDWENYAEQMLSVLSENSALVNKAGDNQYSSRPDSRPETKFEARGKRLGHGVWDILFEKK